MHQPKQVKEAKKTSNEASKSVFTVRRVGVEWLMGLGHISDDDHEKDGVASSGIKVSLSLEKNKQQFQLQSADTHI